MEEFTVDTDRHVCMRKMVFFHVTESRSVLLGLITICEGGIEGSNTVCDIAKNLRFKTAKY